MAGVSKQNLPGEKAAWDGFISPFKEAAHITFVGEGKRKKPSRVKTGLQGECKNILAWNRGV